MATQAVQTADKKLMVCVPFGTSAADLWGPCKNV